MASLFGATFRHHNLYHAAYDAVTRHKNTLPRRNIPSGARVVRSLEREYKGIPNTADTARTIFNGSIAEKNRWTGRQPDGPTWKAGAGGLYVSMHQHALLNEVFHYSRSVQRSSLFDGRYEYSLTAPQPYKTIQVKKVFWEFVVRGPLEVVDFDLRSEAGRQFLNQIQREREVQAALRDASLDGVSLMQLLQSDDHSLPRAFGNAVLLGTNSDGLIVPTARDYYPTTVSLTDLNLIIKGPNSIPLEKVEPMNKITIIEDSNGQDVVVSEPIVAP